MSEQPPPRPDSRPSAETAPGVRVARRAADDADLATVWRERAIDLRRLNRPLRLAAAAVVLAALLAAALIVLRDAPQPRLTIDVDSNHPNVPIPTAAFVVAFALWLVAWSSALAGALHGHWAFRLLVGAAFVYVAIEVVIFNALSLVYIAPLIVVAAWMLAVSAWQWGARRAGRTLPSWFPAVSFGVILVCFAAHYALIWLLGKQATEVLGKQAGDLARVFSELVTLEYEAYGFVLLPILFLTGSDFAEWGEAAAGQLNALLRRFRSPWPLVGVTLLASAAILVYRLIQRGTFAPFDLPSVADLVTLGLFGVIAALLFLGAARLGRAARWSRLPTPAGALVVTTVAVMALLTGPAYLTDFLISLNPTPAGYDVDYSVLRHPASAISPAFSQAYPSEWGETVSEPKNAQDLLAAFFEGRGATGDPRFLTIGVPVAGAGGETLDQLAHDVVTGFCQQQTCAATLTPAPARGPWQVERTVVHDVQANGQPLELDGWVWARGEGSTVWLLYASAEPQGVRAATPIFSLMVDSWRPDLSAQVPVAPDLPAVRFLGNLDPRGVLSLGVIPLALGLFVGLPLLLRGRRRPGPAALAGLFFVVLGLREFLLFFPQILARFGVPIDRIILFSLDPQHHLRLSTAPVLSLPVLQTVAAFFTLATVGWLALRGRVRDGRGRDVIAALLLLNFGLQLIAWIDDLFTATDQLAARFTLAQGVLLVLAFLWDLLTSGEQVTNAEGPRSPRYARVMLYMGYSMLSFSQVLFFSTLAGSASANYTGDWTKVGLTLLGIPLLLTVVLLRLARAGAAPGAPGVGAPEGDESAAPAMYLP